MNRVLCAVLVFVALSAPVNAEEPAPMANDSWSIWGGEIRLRFDSTVLQSLGVDTATIEGGLATQSDPRPGMAITETSALEFRAVRDSIHAFTDGRLQLNGELLLSQGEQVHRLQGASIQPGNTPLALSLVDGNGVTWFEFDHLHYHLISDVSDFRAWNIDIRVSTELATLLGQPLASDLYVGQAELKTHFRQSQGVPCDPEVDPFCDPLYCQPIRWPGDLIDPEDPAAGVYQADVTLNADFPNNLQVSVLRCETLDRTCDGSGGDDARMVIAPSAELRNSDNPNTAAIPWFSKFLGTFPPYGNDQHPLLIWNVYRIENSGERIKQIGRSGVKHAYITSNSGCNGGCPNTHPQNNFRILWPNCQDTYGAGDNDLSRNLGPRSEVVPQTAQWGRCGSVYDADCNGFNDFPTIGDFDFRTEIRESAIDTSIHTGSEFHVDAWYLVRDDINIFNTMGSRRFFPVYSSAWFLSTSGQDFMQGPIIDRWVSPDSVGLVERNRLLDSTEGHLKLAVKVRELSEGQYRYEYAMANFDLARALTLGFEPNLEVVSNRGVIAIELPLTADGSFEAFEFFDGDYDDDNGWQITRSGDVLRIEGDLDSTLDWGTLFSFGFQTDQAPTLGAAALPMAESGTPASYTISTLVPYRDYDLLLADGMEGEL